MFAFCSTAFACPANCMHTCRPSPPNLHSNPAYTLPIVIMSRYKVSSAYMESHHPFPCQLPPALLCSAKCPVLLHREWSSDQAAVLHFTYNRFRWASAVPSPGRPHDRNQPLLIIPAAKQKHTAMKSTSLPHILPAYVVATSSRAATAAIARPPRRTPSAASSCPLTGVCPAPLGLRGCVWS